MAVGGWLADKSALARLATSAEGEEWARRIQRGLVRIATVTRLDVGFEDRAVSVQLLLAEQGHHRAVAVPDLIVTATAELNDLTVLHLDKDFELVAAVTGQAGPPACATSTHAHASSVSTPRRMTAATILVMTHCGTATSSS